MGRVHTTYSRPSLADQIAKGHGTEREVVETYMALRLEGTANNKTLKKVRKALLARFPESALLLIKLENNIA